MNRAMRLVALLSVAAVVASACGSNDNNTSSGGTPSGTKSGPTFKVAMLYDLGGRGDKSFNDSAASTSTRRSSSRTPVARTVPSCSTLWPPPGSSW